MSKRDGRTDMQDDTELIERLQRAVARLEERMYSPGLTHAEQMRLAGKIEGVKLAASYLAERVNWPATEED